MAKAAPGGITHRGAALDMSVSPVTGESEPVSVLFALARVEVECDDDAEELALLTLAVEVCRAV